MFVVQHKPTGKVNRFFYTICKCGCVFVATEDDFAVKHEDNRTTFGPTTVELISKAESVMCPDCGELTARADTTEITREDALQYYAEAKTRMPY